jgi:predicted dehydrogenase
MNGKKSILVRSPEVPDINAIQLELEKFTECILQNKPTPVSELDGYRAMDVAHQILQKIKYNSINT